mmetsp:Transcript_116751/g.371527  ORF Transcript_116751/g.371527 Transcript_116751/m.371527 type:complete len:282 (-) Transcript_116751:156-1001(-)
MAVSFGKRGGITAGRKAVSTRSTKISGSGLQALLEEERERENRGRSDPEPSRGPVQSIAGGRPKVYLEVAIFRGSFFGVEHQEVLEFELFGEAAPSAAQSVLEACAAGKFSDLAFGEISEDTAALPSAVPACEPKALTKMSHDAPGLLSAARGPIGSGRSSDLHDRCLRCAPLVAGRFYVAGLTGQQPQRAEAEAGAGAGTKERRGRGRVAAAAGSATGDSNDCTPAPHQVFERLGSWLYAEPPRVQVAEQRRSLGRRSNDRRQNSCTRAEDRVFECFCAC